MCEDDYYPDTLKDINELDYDTCASMLIDDKSVSDCKRYVKEGSDFICVLCDVGYILNLKEDPPTC